MLKIQSAFRVALAVLAMLFAVSAHAVSPVNTGLFGSTAIKGYDAVAYHTQKKAVKGSSKFVHEWNGAKWQFASEEHLKLFQAAPERYAPQYGGYCAYAVGNNYTAGIDPEAYTLVGDKLYLNYSLDIQKEWEAKRDGYITSGDQNWPGLLKK
jgi:YHS domain-containing protein